MAGPQIDNPLEEFLSPFHPMQPAHIVQDLIGIPLDAVQQPVDPIVPCVAGLLGHEEQAGSLLSCTPRSKITGPGSRTRTHAHQDR